MSPIVTRLFSVMVVMLGASLQASTHKVLFNGVNLDGWQVQGQGQWSVKDSAIHGLNPVQDWAHLITKDTSYTDFYVTAKWLGLVGNSGLFFRSVVGGAYGLLGTQIDFNGPQDGSVMWVNAVRYGWEPAAFSYTASENGTVTPGKWNQIDVEVKGRSIKVWLNKILVTNLAKPDSMIKDRGGFGFQLHRGANNDLYYKDVEVWTPTKISGCGDIRYKEYNAEVNDPITSSCKTLATTVMEKNSFIKKSKNSWKFQLLSNHLIINSENGKGVASFKIKDIFGKLIMDGSKYSSGTALDIGVLQPGIYTISLNNGIDQFSGKFLKQ